jgi:transcription elongation factor Elf1
MPTWLLPILAATALAAAVALVRRHLSQAERSPATLDRRLHCPACGEVVEVEAVQERRTGYFTGVASCQAPGGEALAGCGQACVQALNARAASRLAARSSEA